MSQKNKKFQLSACGGTFDLFHKGHEKFLHNAFKHSDRIIIGLTSEEFAFPKKTFEEFSDRKRSLKKFLDKYSYNSEIVKINDIYGPTIDSDYNFEAIFVTSDSLKGAEEINTKREQFGLSKLKIVKIELAESSDGKAISSNRIRNGEIDREGNLYIDNNLLSSDYLLPENLRDKLSKPFGELIKDFDKYLGSNNFSDKNIVSIGDITTKSFIEKNIIPRLSIVDLIVNRIKKFSSIYDLGFNKEVTPIKVNSPAGHIARQLFKEVSDSLKKEKSVIEIIGEEDLAVIPVVLATPLGYEIYYGQPARHASQPASQAERGGQGKSVAGGPGEGVVKIVISEDVKRQIKELLSQFLRKVL